MISVLNHQLQLNGNNLVKLKKHLIQPILRKLILLSTLLFGYLFSFAQTAQGDYLEAKRLLKNEQYTSAKGAFGALTDNPTFGSYASFYYAFCAYKQGDKSQAMDMWMQILAKNPKWKNKHEVLFWLAHTNFDSGNFDKGIEYSEELSQYSDLESIGIDLYRQFLVPLSVDELKDLYENHTSNRNLAFTYTKKLLEQSYEERDFDEINKLNKKWKFEDHNMSLDELPNLKKDRYSIGVMLPFMYDEDNTEWVIKNDLVMDLYQGMNMALEELKENGVDLDIVAMDTKRSEETTSVLLDNLNESDLDLIIGPLYPGPVDLVKSYSLETQTNMVNPLSSNSQIINDNPYAFLFKPTYETMAIELAKQANRQFWNKNVMIFYENNDRDSLFAATYKKEVEEAGFNVLWYQELTKSNAKSVLDTLIEQYEVFYTKEEADSIREIPNRFVKERRVRQDELRRIDKYESGKSDWDSLYYLPVSINDDEKEVTFYENFLYVEPDSIGHILGATRKNFMANNLISAVETMGDSTVIYGYGKWLDFTMLSYNQLQRINVSMVYPEYADILDSSYLDLETKFLATCAKPPSQYHLQGYDLMMQVGSLLDKYGVYFQKELRKGGYFKGNVLQGLKYGSANDNQIVPIVKFEDAQLKVVNKDSYED